MRGVVLALAWSTVVGLTGPTMASAVHAGSYEPELEWTWSLLGSEIGSAGMLASDLDGDGAAEIFASNRAPGFLGGVGEHWFELRYDGVIHQTWSSLPFDERIVRLRSFTEGLDTWILVATAERIEVYDARSKNQTREIPGIASELRDFFVTDLDADGPPELLLCDDGGIRALDYATLAPIVQLDLDCGSLDVGQADGDLALEVFVNSYQNGVVLDGASWTAEWSQPFEVGAFSRFVDLESDGVEELLCLSELGRLRALRLPSGSELWTATTFSGTDAIADAVFFDGPVPHLLVGDAGYFGGLTAVRALDGTESWSLPIVSQDLLGLLLADADGDGENEALVGTGESLGSADRLVVVDLGAQAIGHETFNLDAPLVGLSLADVDVDGRTDIATASNGSGVFSESGRVVVLDPIARELAYANSDADWHGPIASASLVAQLDADPQLEICTGGGSGSGLLVCQDGSTHLEHWRVQLPHGIGSLAAYDLDEDPWMEVLIGADEGLVYAIDGSTGWLQWRTPNPGQFGTVLQMRIADVYDDESVDLVTCASFTYGCHLALVDLDDGSFTWGPVTFSGPRVISVAENEAGGRWDVLVGDWSGGVARVDLESSTIDPPIATFGDAVEALLVEDLDADGVDDYVVWVGGVVRLYGGAQGTDLWSSPFLGFHGIEPLALANVDRDPEMELAALTYGSLALFELPFAGLFADGFESGDLSAWSSAAP